MTRATALLLAAAAISSVCAAAPRLEDEHRFRQCWQYDLGEGGEQIAADSGTIFVVQQTAVVRAIDVGTGRPLWNSDLGGAVISNLLVTGDSVFVASGQNSQTADEKVVLRSLSKQTGITNWTFQLPTSRRVWLGADAGIVVVVNAEGVITAISAADHSLRWSAHAGGLSAEPMVDAGKLLVDATDNRTTVFSVRDGRPSSVFMSKFGPTAVSFVFDDRIGIGDERGNIYLFDADESSPAWVLKNGARIASIQMTEQGLLAASNDNFLYLMSPGGDIVWKRRLPSRPSIRPIVLGGFAFAAASGEKGLYAVNLDNGKFADQLQTDNEIINAAAIPGGNGIAVLEPGSVVRFSTRQNCSS